MRASVNTDWLAEVLPVDCRLAACEFKQRGHSLEAQRQQGTDEAGCRPLSVHLTGQHTIYKSARANIGWVGEAYAAV